jgi:hypothetical protein
MVGQLPPPQRLTPKGIADVVICIDATGSMATCIDGVKSHVQDLCAGFESNSSQIKLDWRVRLLAYRDLNMGEETQAFPFTNDIEQFRRDVASISAAGGGDEPESTLDVLFQALDSPWREQCNKCIAIFTDATPHPELHPSSVEPGQPRDLDEVINKLVPSKAYVFLYAPESPVYEELAAAPRVTYEVHSDLGLASVDFGKLMEHIGKTVTATTTPVKEDASAN